MNLGEGFVRRVGMDQGRRTEERVRVTVIEMPYTYA